MKIALVSHEYPPFIFGGVGTFTCELAKGLLRKGVEVNVVTGYPTSIKSFGKFKAIKTEEDGLTVFRLPYFNMPPRATIYQLLNFRELSKIFQDLQVDIIHGQSGSMYPMLLNLRNAPILVTFHDAAIMERAAAIQSILRGGSLKDFWTYVLGYPIWDFTYHKEFQKSTAIVAVSNTLKSELLIEMGKQYEKKIRCIHNGVNVRALDSEYAKTENHAEESEAAILFAGRLYWRKGALNIIKIAYLLQKKNSQFKIIVHGTGPFFGKLQSLIRHFGLQNIELRGFTTRDDLMKSMRRCKFIAIPSMYEACPIILLESMCLGKIPLLLNFAFSNELTENGEYGIIGDNLKNLVEKLLAFRNTCDLDVTSKKIRSFAINTYDVDIMTQKYLDLYNEIQL